MIPDTERKTITVLANFHLTHNRMPTWIELETKTGRRQEVLIKAINILEQRGMIKWDGVHLKSIVIDPGWRHFL